MLCAPDAETVDDNQLGDTMLGVPGVIVAPLVVSGRVHTPAPIPLSDQIARPGDTAIDVACSVAAPATTSWVPGRSR